MPPVVVAVAAGVAAGVAAASVVVGVAVAIGTIALTVAMKPEMPKGLAEDIERAQTLSTGSVIPRRGVYGETVVSGTIVGYGKRIEGIANNAKEYHVVAVAIAGHNSESLSIYKVNDKEPPEGTLFRAYLGDQTKVDPVLRQIVTGWTDNHIGRGVTYALVQLPIDQEKLPQGLRNITFKIKGKKVYDPRKDSSIGGNGTHRHDNPATWEWSDNPVLCAFDFLRFQGYRQQPISRFDLADIAAEANVCDELVQIERDGVTVVEKRFTCNGTWTYDEGPADVLQRILISCAGKPYRRGGKIYVKTASYHGPAVLEITTADLAGRVKYRPNTSERERCNVVRATYIDPEAGYITSESPVLRVDEYVTADGAVREHEIRLPFTSSNTMAQRLQKYYLERNRAGFVVEATVGPKGLLAEPGKTVALNLAEDGIVGEFIVADWNYDQTKKTVSLVLIIEQPELYSDEIHRRVLRPIFAVPDNTTVAPPQQVAFAGESSGRDFNGLLTWQHPAPATVEAYIVRIYSDPNTQAQGDEALIIEQRIEGTRLREYPVRDLPAGDYIMDVLAVSKHGKETMPARIFVPIYPPAAPTGINVTGGNFELTVAPIASNLSYSSAFEFDILVGLTIPAGYTPTPKARGITAIFTGLQPNSDYTIFARTVSPYGVSGWINKSARTVLNESQLAPFIADIRAEIERINAEDLTLLRNDLTAAQNEIDAIVVPDLAPVNAEIARVEGLVGTLQTDVNSRLNTLSLDLQTLDGELSQLEVQSANNAQQLTTTQQDLNTLSGNLGTLNNDLSALSTDISARFPIKTADITDGAISAAKIAAAAVEAGKLASGAVTAEKIAALAVNADKIAASAITTAKIADGAIASGKIALGAVTEETIAALAITAAKVADNAVTVNKIAPGAVVESKIADAAITSLKVADLAINADKVAANAITSAKIAAGAVSAGKIAANAVTATEIANLAITSAKVADSAITTAKIADGAIASAKIASGAVDAAKLNIQVGGGNLVTDSSFESEPATWGTYNNSGNASARFDTGRNGGRSRVTIAGSTPGSTLGATKPAAVQGGWQTGVPYIVSFYARKVNGASMAGCQLLWNNGPQSTTALANPALTTSWQRYAFRIQWNAGALVPLSGGFGSLWISAAGSWISGDEIWLDDVQVEQADVLTAYAPMVNEILPGTITATQISDNAITTPKLVAGAVAAGKIAASAVSATELAANAVVADKIASNAITAAKIASNAIEAAKIAAGAVTAGKIAANAVTATEISAGSIVADKIATGAVTAIKVAAGAIEADKIAASAITAEKISAGAVTAGKIAANAVTATEIAAGTITATEIASNAITAVKIAAGAIEAAKIAAGAIQTAAIAAGAVNADQIAASAVTAAKIATNAVTADKIEANAVTAAKIAANAVTATQISAGAVTTAKISAGAVTANEIATNAVTAVKINAGAVEAGKIASNAVTAATIAAGAVTAGKIAANAVTANEIAAGSIIAEKLAILAREYVNPVSITANLIGWGGVLEDGTGGNAAQTYNATERAIQLRTTADLSTRCKTWQVNHDKIYRVSMKIRKTEAAGLYYIGVSAFSANNNGEVAAGSGQGPIGVTPFGTNRVAQTSSSNVYFASGTPSTSYVDHTYYIIGANRDVNDCPAHAGPGTIPFVKLPENGTWIAVRVLNWSNGGTSRDLFIKDVSVTEVGAGQIVAENISASAVTAEKVAASAITADKIATNAVTADKIISNAVTAAKIATGAVSADKIAANAVTADKIAANAITAAKIAAGTITADKVATNFLRSAFVSTGGLDVTEGNNRVRIRPNNQTPILFEVNGQPTFSVNVDGTGFFAGKLAENTVDAAAITDDAKKAINPAYIGGGEKYGTSGTAVRMATGATVDIGTFTTLQAGDRVAIAFRFQEAVEWIEGVSGGSQPSYTTSSYTITLQRRLGSAGTFTNVTGAINLTITPYTWGGFTPPGEPYEPIVTGYSYDVNQQFTDVLPSTNNHVTYRLVVTRTSGSGSTAQGLLRRQFIGEKAAYKLNDLRAISNDRQWVDKETGFSIYTGSRVFTGGQELTIFFSNPVFSEVYSVALAVDVGTAGGEQWNPQYRNLTTSSVVIRNRHNGNVTISYTIYGRVAV